MGLFDRLFGSRKPEQPPRTPTPARPEDLGGPTRALGHLATDKPLYKPGETVYARAAVLQAFTRAPVAGHLFASFEVKSPRGDTVHSFGGSGADGVVPFSWNIPKEQAGGEYKLVAHFPLSGFPDAEVSFAVRAYRVPRLKTELEFIRKAYGPGDAVMATLLATRAEGGAPVGAEVTAVATVDGAEVHRSTLKLDEAGRCAVSFKLPEVIGDGEGTLAMIVRDGGVQETAAKTIPIVVNRVRLAAYPEGGDLVLGLPTRLYVEARTPKGKPADVAGRVVDGAGATLARFRTEHEGRGRVEFTPAKTGKSYLIVLDEPAGVSELYPLPEVEKQGYVLAALDEPGSARDPVRLRCACTHAGKARVALFVREKEVASLPLELEAGQPREVTLTPPEDADGVLRATLLDADGLPRAERLLFRRPTRALQVEVTATPARAGLRDQVEVEVTTRDAQGKPVPALVTLSAVDDAVLETVERRERAPRLPAQVLLQSEVEELMDPQVYLGEASADAHRLDLLLGTQGWRRFAFYDAEKFVAAHGDAAERALARCKPPPPPPPPQFMPMPAGAPVLGAPPGGAPRGMPPPRPAPIPHAPPPNPAPVMKAEAPPPPQPVPDAGLAMDDDRARPAMGAKVAMDMPAERPAQMPPAAIAAPAPMPPMGIAMGAPMPMARMAMAKPAMPPPPPVMAVREYAHRVAVREGAPRTDFAETLYWNAGLATDEKGKARLTFDLADSVTTFQVRADAFGKDGALGWADAPVEARRPFYLEPKLPLEVTAGDRIDVPIALVNGTSRPVEARLSLKLTGPVEAGPAALSTDLKPEGRSRLRVPLQVGSGRGAFPVRIEAQAGSSADDVTRPLEVVPAGFPMEIALGGMLEGKVSHTVRIPAGVQPGSLVAEAFCYPTPLAALAQAVAALLREPCGCFEQTSSSTYPNVMVMQYLSTHHGSDPEIAKRAADLIDRGYQRLVGYECKEKGYEWFGGDPGHEALTAYGVMEFTDMAQVFQVDQAMLERTRAWLLSRRDGKGGYERNARALDTFGGAPPDITDAYITWALTQARVPGLEKEVGMVRNRALEASDAYYLALCANVLLDVKEGIAPKVLDRLAAKQDKDGAVRGAATSITRSGGEALEIETTALAVLAWMRSPAHAANCQRAMAWLVERCKGGRFGSTQSTILALRAIVAYDAANARPRANGALALKVDGKVVGEAQFKADHTGAIALPSFAEALTPGEHQLELLLAGGSAMPYSVQVRYHADVPASAPACKVALSTALVREELAEGEAVDLRVELRNTTTEGLPMVVAILGLPGGLEARADQLKELVKEGKIDFFETRGREVILYRRGMGPAEKSALVLSLIAAVPGSYTGPASRAYLYYTDEDKVWVSPLKARIQASS